jgi:DUF4097 and DUF4098 domain-containing protein YvlB
MIRRLIPVALAALLASPVLAQQRQADFRWQGTVAAGGEVSLHNINGDISVVPSTNGRVEVVGIKHGNSAYFDHIKVEVQPTSRGITVCVLFDTDDAECDDRGYHSNGRNNRNDDREWNNLSINLQVSIPSNLEVSAGSVSGDVDITGAGGDVSASSVSGDVRLDKLHARSVHATTVSGDVVVRVDEFTGRGDLKFNTVSGDVTLEVPKGFDADLSMSSVSGKVDSDFQLVVGGSGMRRGNFDGRIGNGGRRLDLNTVSGDLRIRSIN